MSLHHEKVLEEEICEHLSTRGWLYSADDDGYDKERALYPEDLFAWLRDTQAEVLEKLAKTDKDRDRLLDRLCESLDRPLTAGGGTLAALRYGFKFTKHLDLCQFKPAESLNRKTAARYAAVRLRVMRQVRYSTTSGDAIDLVLFVNGLPLATAELKSQFTQDVYAAIAQYKADRLPVSRQGGKREPLLSFGHRALVHFAVDEFEVHMSTRLEGNKTVFLPFNQGNGESAGNPPSALGAPTAYLWEKIFDRHVWLNILGKFMHVQIKKSKDPDGGGISRSATLLFPRFHQYDAVSKMLEDARLKGAGQRYLVQHSAGSGKTNSIAWLSHQLSTLHDQRSRKVFDSVLVITDRTVLDDQLQDAIYQIDHKRGVVLPIGRGTDSDFLGRFASKSEALVEALAMGGAIVIVTIQTVPHALAAIRTSTALAKRNLAVIIDEAHSSQTGLTATRLRRTLAGVKISDDEDLGLDDLIRLELEGRGQMDNVSFFAFTATPKGKTVQLFGTSHTGEEVDKRPFHLYSMQQAIEEGFILDVLKNYVAYRTAFRLVHNGQDYDTDKVDRDAALKSVMSWVKLHPHNINQKVAIIMEHFRINVAPLLGRRAKAMVVADSRKAAVRYKIAFDRYLNEHHITDVATLVAFSGDVVDDPSGPMPFGEASMNRTLRGRSIPEALASSDFQILIVANKFQTGFDEPLLCAMYVDKQLSGVQAVQTLSRLNRTYPGKTTFVLDFANEPESILAEFKKYYRGAELSQASDPNLVFDQWDKLEAQGIFSESDVQATAKAYFGDGKLKPSHARLASAISSVRDIFNAAYSKAATDVDNAELDRLDTFRRDLRTFVNTYEFLGSIVDYESVELEKQALFARMLAEALKDSQRHDADVDLSGVSLTHLAVQRQPARKLDLTGRESEGLSSVVAAGSRSHHHVELVPWGEVLELLNSLFEGDGLSDGDQVSAVQSVVRKMLENEDLRAQARANNKQDFFSGPDLWTTLQEVIVEAGDQHNRGIERLAADRSRSDIMTLLSLMRLWETLRDLPDQPSS